jgi:hypothetical protein
MEKAVDTRWRAQSQMFTDFAHRGRHAVLPLKSDDEIQHTLLSWRQISIHGHQILCLNCRIADPRGF